MAKLLVQFKNQVDKEVAIGPKGIKIGRNPDNDIQIDNIAVSRQHAEIYRQGHAYYVEDLKSTNGVVLNGRQLNWKSSLNHQDKITIGKHTLVFVQEPKDGAGKKRVEADETLCLRPADLARLRENS
jgi:pSer/pThr/pTyr-binding forkhead associated (FHA) protein